jgi:hypothetical protein
VPLAARQGRSPSAGLVSLHQLAAQRLLSFWFGLLGVGVADGKGAQKCLVEDDTAGWNRVGDSQARRGAGRPLYQQPVRLPARCCRELRCYGTAGRSGAVATVSSGGLATMGVDVLLKGESCLLRFQASLVRDLLKVLVFLFRRGSHSST